MTTAGDVGRGMFRREGPVRHFLRPAFADPFAIAGVSIYGFFLAVALLADQIAPHDPQEILFRADGRVHANAPAFGEFILGTTNLGRDVFSQVVYGTQSTLLVGITAALFVVAIGTVIGVISGYFGRWVDSLLMRVADVVLAIPFLPFCIVLAAFLGSSIWNIVLAVALLLWPNTARVIRSQVLIVRERTYVEAARMLGSPSWKILLVHIAPSILPLSLLYGSVAIGWAILTEASVSFMGFSDPQRISWGFMLQDAFNSQALSRGSWHWFLPPGICIILVVLAGFFLSRGIEEILFPKLRAR